MNERSLNQLPNHSDPARKATAEAIIQTAISDAEGIKKHDPLKRGDLESIQVELKLARERIRSKDEQNVKTGFYNLGHALYALVGKLPTNEDAKRVTYLESTLENFKLAGDVEKNADAEKAEKWLKSLLAKKPQPSQGYSHKEGEGESNLAGGETPQFQDENANSGKEGTVVTVRKEGHSENQQEIKEGFVDRFVELMNSRNIRFQPRWEPRFLWATEPFDYAIFLNKSGDDKMKHPIAVCKCFSGKIDASHLKEFSINVLKLKVEERSISVLIGVAILQASINEKWALDYLNSECLQPGVSYLVVHDSESMSHAIDTISAKIR